MRTFNPYNNGIDKFQRQYWRRRRKLMEEFKALCSLVPTSEVQHEEVLRRIAEFQADHPELKLQIDAYFDKLIHDSLEQTEKESQP